MTVLTIVIAVLAWSAFIWRWRQPGQSLRKPLFTDEGVPTDVNALRCLAALAGLAFFYTIPVARLIDSVTVNGLAAALMFCCVIVGASELVMALRITVKSRAEVMRFRVPRRVLAGASMTVLVAAVLMGQPQSSDVSQYWGSTGPMVAFWSAALAYFVWAGVMGTVLSIQRQRGLPACHLRTQIRWLAVASSGAATYAVIKAVTIAGVIGWIPELPAALLLIAVCVTTMAVAGVLGATWQPLCRAWGLRNPASKITQLEPLWLRLRPVNPTLVRRGSTDRERLYRMSVEIRDWLRPLSWRLPVDAWERAVASAQGDEAIAAAGWIEAGLAASAVEPCARVTPPLGVEVADQIAALIAVANVRPEQASVVAADLVKVGEK